VPWRDCLDDPPARAPAPEKIPARDRTILRLKVKERSNRWIAGRLGLSETAIRKAPRRLGWNPGPEPSPLPLPFELQAGGAQADPITASVTGNPILEVPPSAAPSTTSPRTPLPTPATAKSIDPNPLDRSMDRLLASMGLLDDALPMFARAQNLPRAGVLVAKMVAFQIESDLVEMIRPHYKRAEDEGRTLVQTILQDAADIEPAEGELRITLAPLSSPHRSRVVESLCAALNKTNTMFPGTQLQMRFAVAQPRS